MVPGFCITDSAITGIAAYLAERVAVLDPDKFVVSVKLLDNMAFEW
jgi:hypothetical protein